MQTPMSPILAYAVVLFTTIVVVPGVFILWKKKWSLRRLQHEEEVWNLLRAERALRENEDSDEHRDLFFRAIIKGNITQRKKAKIRLILWLIFSFFWAYLIFSYLYFSLDRSAPTLTFLDSFDPLAVTFGVLAFVAGLLSAFYEKTKLRNINILLHDFGEANAIKGRVTLEKLEKLDSIKKLR